MRFGPVPLDDAIGAILAHSHAITGGRLRKGRVLGAGDIAALRDAGATEVVVAQLDARDLDENAAATKITSALVADPAASHLHLTRASTGRVNIYATGPGVLDLNVARIEAANRVDPLITLATLPPFARTRDRGMVATVKIISYAVKEAHVDQVADLLRGAMRVRPVQLRTASLIITDIGTGPGKGEEAMRARLDALGMTLKAIHVVPHQTDPLARAIAGDDNDLTLILTASATSDPHDVAPEALRAAGGQVTRYGMPVDPGNLLFLGHLGTRPVIGLPGCARAPALNGADWVLERIACGVPVSDADIAAMGVGGLLKESPARPHPREKR